MIWQHFILQFVNDKLKSQISKFRHYLFHLLPVTSFIVRSFTDENLSSLLLPSDVTSLLSTPTGHCFICCNPYFTAAFPLKESAATALQVVKPSSLNLQRLREIQCTFVFCCCSRRCLSEVWRMRDIPDWARTFYNGTCVTITSYVIACASWTPWLVGDKAVSHRNVMEKKPCVFNEKTPPQI